MLRQEVSLLNRREERRQMIFEKVLQEALRWARRATMSWVDWIIVSQNSNQKFDWMFRIHFISINWFCAFKKIITHRIARLRKHCWCTIAKVSSTSESWLRSACLCNNALSDNIERHEYIRFFFTGIFSLDDDAELSLRYRTLCWLMPYLIHKTTERFLYQRL